MNKKGMLFTVLFVILMIFVSCNNFDANTSKVRLESVDLQNDSGFVVISSYQLILSDNDNVIYGSQSGLPVTITNVSEGVYNCTILACDRNENVIVKKDCGPIIVKAGNNYILRDDVVTLPDDTDISLYFAATSNGSLEIRPYITESNIGNIFGALSSYIDENHSLDITQIYNDVSEKFSLEESLKTICYLGLDLFDSGVEKVNIPDGVDTIGVSAFEGCATLKTVGNLDNVKTFGSKAFKDCSALVNIRLPKTITAIPLQLFSGCVALTDFSDSGFANIKYVHAKAFEDCSSLTCSETLQLDSIGELAFCNCTSLNFTSLNCSDIGNSAFMGCSGLTEIAIVSNNTFISYSCFCGCTNLTSVVLPKSVERISDNAFAWDSKLIKVSISKKIAEIGYHAFDNCGNLDVYYEGSLIPEDWDISWCGNSNVVIHYNALQ